MRQSRRRLLDSALGSAVAFALSASLALTALSLGGSPAWSQSARTIKMVVPIGPGSGLDIMARLVAEQVSRTQGVTAVVENRPGAVQVLATDAVAAAAPDGNTVLFMADPFLINPYLKKVAYDPLTTFDPVCNLASQPQLIVVNSASPYRTLADLVAAARAKPGQPLRFTSHSSGSSAARRST
jgi:tripartite-type tricarboxylate transporter receptor subunit TctC